MPGSVRDYAILWVGASKGGVGAGGVALGGNALLTTAQHRLDGVEHLAAADTTRLDASVDAHGLAPKLSGDVGDVWRGDGTFGPGVSALDDLTDVTIIGATTGDRLRFDGSVWRNSVLIWKPVMDGSGNVVTDSGTGEAIMAEVAP